jgi:hypothetical protein
MHLQLIPRGTLVASLTCIDLLSRLKSGDHDTNDMRHAVAVVSSYLMDLTAVVSDDELAQCLAMVERLDLS